MNDKKNIKICAIVIAIIIALVFINQCTNILMNKVTRDIKNEKATIETTENINDVNETLNFDINKSPMLYIDNEAEYIDNLKPYIKPAELANFIDFKTFKRSLFNDCKNGYEAIERYVIRDAYKNFFCYLFENKTFDYDNCPVTDAFRLKFKNGVYNYFELDDKYEYLFETLLDNNMFRIDAKSYELGEDLEPKYGWNYDFKYLLDEDGNINDIIFDHKE